MSTSELANGRAPAPRTIVIGAGLAGLMTALHLSPRPCILVSGASLGGQSSSALAQGGMAAAVGADDSPALHLEDTIAAGAGLCDARVAERIVSAAPAAIEELIALGVPFDLDSQGRISLGREAAHSRFRIVHAAGDATGREMTSAIIRQVRRAPSVTILEECAATELLRDGDSVVGAQLTGPSGAFTLEADHVVLATGGVGGLFAHTTNPGACFGHGLALAARAGAVLSDIEFIQFHPTALDFPKRPMTLISEAVRGEGAILVNDLGERFLADTPGAELATRDVVARAVWREVTLGRCVFLDARQALGPKFARRFPSIAGLCAEAGVDPARDLIPVRPAAHYHMGGVKVDDAGRTSVPGLWACGEAASTGLHGANRLASNSLLEAVVCAKWVADDIASAASTCSRRLPAPRGHAHASDADPIRAIAERHLGVIRDGQSLETAIATLAAHAQTSDPALVALMIAVSAWRRTESRGSHFRSDYPHAAINAVRSDINLESALETARAISER